MLARSTLVRISSGRYETKSQYIAWWTSSEQGGGAVPLKKLTGGSFPSSRIASGCFHMETIYR